MAAVSPSLTSARHEHINRKDSALGMHRTGQITVYMLRISDSQVKKD